MLVEVVYIVCTFRLEDQCSPQHKMYGILLLYPCTGGLSLMWDWSGANGFDVDAGSTQNTVCIPNMLSIQTWENTIVAHVQCTCMYLYMYMYVHFMCYL